MMQVAEEQVQTQDGHLFRSSFAHAMPYAVSIDVCQRSPLVDWVKWQEVDFLYARPRLRRIAVD